MIPEIPRRSSTRRAPRRPRGKYGAIRAPSSSLNQNSFLAIQAACRLEA
jgi:hypothetical protein